MHSHSDLTWPYITGEIYGANRCVVSSFFYVLGNVIAKKSWFKAQLVQLAYTYAFFYYENKKIKEIKIYIKYCLIKIIDENLNLLR